jgi:hypothetical protein
MTFVTDIRHFLDDHGRLRLDNLPLRRRALRLAQLVEAGGPLEAGQFRETLVPCPARSRRTPCLGLQWVEKTRDRRIFAWCPACHRHETLISGWEMTPWAAGPMEPATDDELDLSPDVN